MDEQQRSLWDEASIDTALVKQTANDLLDGLDEEVRALLAAGDETEISPEEQQHRVAVLSAHSDTWLQENADPLSTEEFATLLQQLKPSLPDMPKDPAHADDDHARLLFRSLWKEHRVIPASDLQFYRVRTDPPAWLMGMLGLTDSVEPSKRLARRSITSAFMVGGRTGVGRIPSSQISIGLFETCISPKDKWQTTAKGFPKYTSRQRDTEIAFLIRPETIERNGPALERQIREMEEIKQELSIRDWNSIAALMAQVISDNTPDARSFMYSDTILDYRGVERQKDRDGYSAGHQQNMRLAVGDSIHRLSHLYVVTKTLKVRRAVSNGRVEYDTVDWNEKVLQLHGNATRREDDVDLAWEYSFGQWFTTFLEKPNRFVAYLLQRALGYHPVKQQWTAHLANYLILEMRRNADNKRDRGLYIGDLMEKVAIPQTPRFPNRAKDRIEKAIRDVVADGLFRIEHDGKIIDACSPELAEWTAASRPLPSRNWFDTYKKEVVVFRADPETERHYDEEIRRAKAGSQKKRPLLLPMEDGK